MLKHLLNKVLGSVMHGKHGRRRYTSSAPMRPLSRRHSSDHGYGNNRQGQGYYKNRYGSSS